MALNQTQRDHALKMVEAAINEKKNVISVKAMSKLEYINANFKMGDKFTIGQILGVTTEKYYAASVDILSLLGVTDAYDEYCNQVRQNNTLATAGLTALEFDLKGVIMFGNDFSVVSDALERIANFS